MILGGRGEREEWYPDLSKIKTRAKIKTSHLETNKSEMKDEQRPVNCIEWGVKDISFGLGAISIGNVSKKISREGGRLVSSKTGREECGEMSEL